MSLATALLTPILGDASPWTPRRLFQLGEAGGVYDPSDLTAEKVAWRRNLLTWSEDFTNAAWVKTNATVTANATAAPDGTVTADEVVETAAAGVAHRIQATITNNVGPLTVSWYAKQNTRTVVQLLTNVGANTFANFDLASGTIGTVGSNCTAAIQPAGSGWYRISISLNATSTSITVYLALALSATDSRNPAYNGDGTSGVFAWGAQAEQSPTATAYQRITDFTSDFLAAFPTHGLYQDAAGTTPVTALGQPVGLVIDSKTGGLANVGPELVTNGDFATNLNGWTLSRTSTASLPVWDAGGMRLVSDGTGFSRADQQLATVAGQSYRVRFSLTMPSSGSGSLTFAVGSTQGASNLLSVPVVNATSTFQYVFVATGTASWLRFETGSSNIIGFLVDNVTANLVPGVHAIQATNSSRPLLDGRVNLLTYSEQFDNAAWVKAGVSVTANNAVAPDGTTTADRYVESALNEVHSLGVANVAATNGATYILSVYGKDAGRFLRLILPAGTFGTAVSANFDLVNGVAYDTAGTGATIENVGSGWFRCSIRVTATTSAVGSVSISSAVTSSGTGSYAGDGTSGILVWGADLRLAADSAYPYQRVAAATDYADVGVPRSFAFDGFDDSLYTASNMDLSGTDKVTVLAGVRKLSDAAAGMLMETSANYNTNNGSWVVTAPENTGASGDFSFNARGTSQAGALLAAGLAPIIRVLAALANIAAPSRTLRINGATAASSALSFGTGNFGSHVLFIGRRNNASIPFNGKAYQLIVRGALTDAATLAQAERYVGAKTGLYL